MHRPLLLPLTVVPHAPPGPAHGHLHRFPRRLARARIVRALVEHHHDVAAERQLHIHRRFRREQVLVAVEVRTKHHALFLQLPQLAQRPHLEAARIGQNRPRPRHEAVQPAVALHQLMTWTQVEMVRVRQDDLRVQLFQQLPGRHALHRSLGPHRHENRRLNGAMGGMQPPGSGACVRAHGLNFKAQRVQGGKLLV